jgi:hypothetical protein
MFKDEGLRLSGDRILIPQTPKRNQNARQGEIKDKSPGELFGFYSINYLSNRSERAKQP